jgi:hypothetical protein
LIFDETIWSLTSPRVKRISGSKNFRSSPQKDFCNNIGTKRTWRDVRLESVMRSQADMDQASPVADLTKAGNRRSAACMPYKIITPSDAFPAE